MSDATSATAKDDGTVAFDLVRRGYRQDQVDQHVQSLVTQLGEARRAWQNERHRAERADRQLREAQVPAERQAVESAEGGDSDTQQGFGYRVEKLLRAAEQEAGEARSSAAREATALLERAREDAETERHQAEQSLISRAASIEQQAAQRQVQLDEREREITERAATAQDEIDAMPAQARRDADQVREQALARAEYEHQSLEKSIRERHTAAETEIARLSDLHQDVQGKLARLLTALASEFDGRPGAADDRPGAAPGADSVVRGSSPTAHRPSPSPRPRVGQDPRR